MFRTVSVIIPAYNRPQMLRRALDSVIAQTYKDFELILVDDGSEDDLSDIASCVEDFGGRYLRTDNQGVSSARNLGVSVSGGHWLAFLDSDDTWHPEKLARQLAFFEEYPQLQLAQTEERWVRKGRFVNACLHHQKPEGEAFSRSLDLCCISPSSVILSRSIFEQAGGFDPRLRVCEDYDLWLKLTSRYPLGLLREDLVTKYGGHNDQLSRSAPALDRFRVYSILRLLREGELSEKQRLLCWEKLAEKCKILAEGARKRERGGLATYCEELVAFSKKAHLLEAHTSGEELEEIWKNHEEFLLDECG